MDIKYYGVEGAEIESSYESPNYFVELIAENQDELLRKGSIKIPIADVNSVTATIYENGVIYNFAHSAYPGGSTAYDKETYGSIIVGPEGASFIVSGIDHHYNSDSKVLENEKENIALLKKLREPLGKEIDTSLVFEDIEHGHSYNPIKQVLINKSVKRQEKDAEIQREIFNDRIAKSMVVLEQVRASLEENETHRTK